MLTWGWSLQEGAGEFDIGLRNLRIEVGSFISEILKPITDTIADVLEPFKPVVDVLLTPLPGLDAILEDPTLLGVINFVAGLMGQPGIDPAFLHAVKNMIDIALQVDALLGTEGEILLGDIIGLGSGDVSTIASPSGLPQELSSFLDRLAAQGSGEDVSTGVSGGFSSEERSGFQIIEYITDIGNWAKLLTGGDATLFTYEMPLLSFGFDFRQRIGTITAGPAIINIDMVGGFSMTADLGFGYDTFGIRRAIETGNPWEAFDGFFISDFGITTGEEKDEFTFRAELGLEAALSLVLIEAGLGGIIGFEMGLDLNDIEIGGESDGKIRISELITMWNYTGNGAPGGLLNIINLAGRVFLEIYLFVDVGISLPFIGKIMARIIDITLVDLTLVEWEYKAPNVEPVLAHDEGSTLVLHTGKRAADREYLDIDDAGEIVKVSGDSSAITVEYSHWTQTFDTGGYTKVIADGGDGNDRFDASELTGVEVEFTGGFGEDQLSAGSAGGLLDGGDDNDTLGGSAATAPLTMLGGKGDDRLTGGSAADVLDGGDGEDRLSGGGGADEMRGGKGADQLAGGEGDDEYYFEEGYNEDSFRDSQGTSLIDLSGVSSPSVVQISPTSTQITTGGSQIRLGRSSLSRIILGTGYDEVYISSMPEGAMEIEDAGGPSKITVQLDRPNSTKASGTLTIFDDDADFDELTLLNVSESIELNDHQVVNGRETFNFDDDLESVVLHAIELIPIVVDGERTTDSEVQINELTITTTNGSGTVFGLTDLDLVATTLTLDTHLQGDNIYVTLRGAPNLAAAYADELAAKQTKLILGDKVFATGDFDADIDIIASMDAFDVVSDGAIDHRIDAHDLDFEVALSDVSINAELNGILDGSIRINANFVGGDGNPAADIDIFADIYSSPNDDPNAPDGLASGTLRFVPQGILTIHGGSEFLGAGAHLILAGDDIYNTTFVDSNRLVTTVGGITVLTRPDGIADGSEIEILETDDLVIHNVDFGADGFAALSSAYEYIHVRLQGVDARLTLDSGTIITQTGGKNITLIADDFNFQSGPSTIIGTADLTIITEQASQFVLGSAAEHPLGNDWTDIIDEFPNYNTKLLPAHVGGNFTGEGNAATYDEDDTLFNDTAHLSTRDLASFANGFDLITIGEKDGGNATAKMIIGDAWADPNNGRNSAFRDEVVLNATKIFVEGQLEIRAPHPSEYPVPLTVNTDRLHIKSKDINNQLGGLDSGITGDLLNLKPSGAVDGIRNRLLVDGWLRTDGDIEVDILGQGEYYTTTLTSGLNNIVQGPAGQLETTNVGGVIDLKSTPSIVLEGQSYVTGNGSRVDIDAGTFFELRQIAGVISAPDADTEVNIHAPEAAYINGEILAGVEWQGGVKQPSQATIDFGGTSDVNITTDHELRIYGAISSADELNLTAGEDQDYNALDQADASIHLTGQLFTLGENKTLVLTVSDGGGGGAAIDELSDGKKDILIEGSIFVRGDGSGLFVDSPQRVKFATSLIEVADGIEIYGNAETEDADYTDAAGNIVTSSVLIEPTAVITSFAAGSNVEIYGAGDIDVYGTVLAGGSIGPTGVTWTGPDSQAIVEAGERVYVNSGILASDTVTVRGGLTTEDDDLSRDPSETHYLSVLIDTAGGLTAAGRTSDNSPGLVEVFGASDIEIMGHLWAGADRRLLFDGEGNLIDESIDWSQSNGGDILIESSGQIFVGGYTQSFNNEVQFTSGETTFDVTLDFEFDGGAETATVSIEGDDTTDNLNLADLVVDIQDAFAVASISGSTDDVADRVSVSVDQNRLVFSSAEHFTIAQTSTNQSALGLPGGESDANEVLPDAYVDAANVPVDNATFQIASDVTLVILDADGELEGDASLEVASTTDNASLEDLLDDLLDALEYAGLEYVSAEISVDKLRLTSPYDFRLGSSSVNESERGFVASGGDIDSSRDEGDYEVRAPISLFGDVVDTGGYLAAKDIITIQNIDTLDNPYSNATDIGIKMEGASEVTTYGQGSSIVIDSMEDAEILGHLIAGGEVEVIRDAETGAYVGAELIDLPFREDTEVHITTEHQLRVGTDVRAGGLIALNGGEDPGTPDENDPFDFTGTSVLLFGSVKIETWGENSEIQVNGSGDIRLLTATHFHEVEPTTWPKGEFARLVSEGKVPLDGIIPADVTLRLLGRFDGNDVETTVTIPASDTLDNPYWDHDDDINTPDVFNAAVGVGNLVEDIQNAFADAGVDANFAGMDISHVGRQLTFTLDNDFEILMSYDATGAAGAPDPFESSYNIDLLALTSVLSSRKFYLPAEIFADDLLPGTGELIRDVTLELEIEDGLGGTVTDTIVVTAASTSGNADLDDLIDDINAALDANSDFAVMDAENRSGTLVLKTIGFDFELLSTSLDVNQLGIRGDYETVETRYPSILTADEAAPETGELARDVVLILRIDETTLDDTLLGAVFVTKAAASDNSSLADLVADINTALDTTEIPRYGTGEVDTPLDFGDYLSAELRDGKIVLLSDLQPGDIAHAFKIKRASQAIGLLGWDLEPQAQDDILAAKIVPDAVLSAAAVLPGSVLAEDLRFDIAVYRGGERLRGWVNVTAAATSDNLSPADLVDDINAAFVLDGFDDVSARLTGSTLELVSSVDFNVTVPSLGLDALGFTTVLEAGGWCRGGRCCWPRCFRAWESLPHGNSCRSASPRRRVSSARTSSSRSPRSTATTSRPSTRSFSSAKRPMGRTAIVTPITTSSRTTSPRPSRQPGSTSSRRSTRASSRSRAPRSTSPSSSPPKVSTRSASSPKSSIPTSAPRYVSPPTSSSSLRRLCRPSVCSPTTSSCSSRWPTATRTS